MIYQDVKRFLKGHLKNPSTEYEWSGRDNFLLLGFLQGRYSDEHIDNNAMDIRQAFRDFLEPIGNALVRYTKDVGIHYKIFPYHVEPSKSKHLKALVQIIRENRRSIEYPHNERLDQIALLGKIRRAINAQIAETDENVNKRELIRYAIKEALELSSQDVVLHLKKKYLIKLFQKNTFVAKAQISEKEELQSKKVINEEELKEDYKELFKDVNIQDFIDQVMVSLFADALNFEKINNSYYEKNVLSLIRKEIAYQLTEYISDNDEYVKNLADYVMKENLIQLHERIAIEIFEKITNKDVNARNFLNYYTGQIYVENGKRYIIPEIATEDGKRWNINSLISTSSVWLRSRSLLLQTKVQLENVDQKINEITPDFNTLKQQLHTQNTELNQALKKHKEMSEALEEGLLTLKSEISTFMNQKKEAALDAKTRKDKQMFNELKHKINAMLLEKSEKERALGSVQTVLTSYSSEAKILTQKIQGLEKDLAVGSEAFNSILASVVKALMKRKAEVN